ncbi:MAG: hypothetical protein LN568_04945 [Rickettsia endosymbiont of Pseudomimeciton antennatum]|nr:hypothetical protein [Rickettsia endosymbiont of Pseudomimeciton antennatum]
MKKISNIAKIMKTAISGAKKSVIFIDITELDVTWLYRIQVIYYHVSSCKNTLMSSV